MQKMQIKQSIFQRIKNPYIVGNPIKSEDMFFGRGSDFALIREWIATDGLPVILLIGSRRSGKTSMLMQIKNNRMSDICESAFFDCNAVIPRIKQDADFPLEIAKSILENPIFSSFSNTFYEGNELTARQRLKNLVDACIQHISPKKLVILVDEVESLENIFEDTILTRHALDSINDILTKPVFFIMTSSGSYTERHISEVFGHITQHKAIYELSLEDTTKLIRQPVESTLTYEDKVVEEIYRLSGGKTFFTQHICHTLVNHVNAVLKKQIINREDLDDVIDFIINNPVGHIQETWKKFADVQKYPKNTLHFLAALAASVENSHQYVNKRQLLKTRKERHFHFSNEELRKLVAFFKTHSRLIEWNAKGYRFRIDIMRQWIAHYYQTGEDIEEYLLATINPNKIYAKKLQTLLKKTINFKHREELDQLQHSLQLSYNETEEIEHELRNQLKLRSINWQKEYESNCLYIKNKYSNSDIRKKIKLINTLYVDSSRLSRTKAREICKRYNLVSVFIPYVFISIAILLTGVGASAGLYFYTSKISNSGRLQEDVKTPSKNNRVIEDKITINTSDHAEKKEITQNNLVTLEEIIKPRYSDEENTLLNDTKKILATTDFNFSDTLLLCHRLNEKLNGDGNTAFRKLYLQVLEMSLTLIPERIKDEKHINWLKVQQNNIEVDAKGKYFITHKFRQEMIGEEILYGSIEIDAASIDVDVILKNKDEGFLCNKRHKCQIPLKKSPILAGKKVFNFSNKNQTINIDDTINIHPNQEFIYILE